MSKPIAAAIAVPACAGSARAEICDVAFGNVGSRAQLNTQRIGGALGGIMEPQAFAHFASLDPHRGVVAWVVTGGLTEGFDADGAFFEDISGAAPGCAPPRSAKKSWLRLLERNSWLARTRVNSSRTCSSVGRAPFPSSGALAGVWP
jgi:hypothetical protein